MFSRIALVVGLFLSSYSMAIYQKGRVVPSSCGQNETGVVGGTEKVNNVCEVVIQGYDFQRRLLSFNVTESGLNKIYIFRMVDTQSLPLNLNQYPNPKYVSVQIGIQIIGEEVNGNFKEYYFVHEPEIFYLSASVKMTGGELTSLAGTFKGMGSKNLPILVKIFRPIYTIQ